MPAARDTLRWTTLLGMICLSAAPLRSQEPPSAAAAGELVDRILAVVNDDPILASEVDQAIALGIVEPRGDEDAAALRRRVLDLLIDERVRFHEIDRFGFTEVPLREVEERFQEIQERVGPERLEELGLDEEQLRNLVARQLAVLTFVEERLGPRVFVDLDRIRAYYEEVLVPELRGQGEAVPPVEQVREQIRAVLKEELLNEELERWTEELRLEADVEDYWEEEGGALPEVVIE